MRKLILLIIAVTFIGCGGESQPQDVEIVRKHFDENCSSNAVTIVEFPDRSRWERCGDWGEVGDTILAYKTWDPLSGVPYNWKPAK